MAVLPPPSLVDVSTYTFSTVNQSPTGVHTDQTLCALQDGSFLVIWSDRNGVGGGDIMGRHFMADGRALSNEFRINSNAAGIQGDPTAVQLADGRIIVAWDDSSVGNIEFAQVTLGTTPSVTTETVVTTIDAADDQRQPVVERYGNGFILTYTDTGRSDVPVGTPGGPNDVRQIIFDSSLVATSTGNFIHSNIGNNLGTSQDELASARLNDGRVVTVWSDDLAS